MIFLSILFFNSTQKIPICLFLIFLRWYIFIKIWKNQETLNLLYNLNKEIVTYTDLKISKSGFETNFPLNLKPKCLVLLYRY